MSITGDLGNMSKAVVNGLPVTGDSYQYKDEAVQGIKFVNFPVAAKTNLLSGNNPVNNYQSSGKGKGTLVIKTSELVGVLTSAALMASVGKAAQDKWIMVKQLVGSASADVTPTKPTPNTSIIGDIKAINEVPYEGILFASYGECSITDLADANAIINQKSLSGKKVGSLVIATDASNEAIMVASGSSTTDAWIKLIDLKGTVANTTPVASATTVSVIGDIAKPIKNKDGVYMHSVPSYPDAEFKKVASVENDTKRSGKRLGSIVVLSDGTNTGLYMATGDKANSKWVVLVSLVGTATDITPA